MSVARPAHSLLGRWCLASTPSPATRRPVAQCRHQFHSSTPRPKRRSRFRNVTAEALGLLDPSKLAEYREKKFPEYSEQEQAALSKKYTPEQLEAIEAGERAVNPDDMIMQGRLRDDPYQPNYVEDYTELDPRYDIKPEVEVTPKEPQWLSHKKWTDNYSVNLARLLEKKTSDQLTRAMVRALRRVKESKGPDMIDLTEEELDDFEKDPELLERHLAENNDKAAPTDAPQSGFLTEAELMALNEAVDAELEKEIDVLAAQPVEGELEPTNLELTEHGPAGSSRIYSAEAPELGKVPGVEGMYKSADDLADQGQDDSGNYRDLMRQTGLSLTEIQSIYRKVLVMRQVSNQTRLGKVRSTSVVAIAGNGNGWLGLGIAKSTDMTQAMETAQMSAVRNMKPIRRYENRTIYGNVKAKVSGTIVELFARPPGFGLRCPHRIFEMCRASGLHDIAARMPRSKNPMNSVKAAYEALMDQPDPEAIAIGRGKKLVDVRKVYYGGAVY